MTGISYRIALALVALGCSFGSAAAQGPIGTVLRGPYQCELPGDAAGQAGIPQPQASFVIETSSLYSSPQGKGAYLRRGERLMMTSGPRQGESYAIVSKHMMRRMENGRPGRLRCVLSAN